MIFFKWCKPLELRCVSPHRRSKFKIATTLQLLIALISFSTASAIVKAQEINLKVKDATLESVFNEIKKQTGYGFFYDKADVTNAKITITIKNAGLKETLDQCFKDQPYSYEVFDKTIVVKRKAKSNSGQIPTPIDLTISGKVTDEKGEPIPGVTVKIKSNGKIALTDHKGEFTITIPSQDAILQFTYIGYATVERVIGKASYLTIVLKEEANTLQSVEINAGYYTVKERERTGSIARITSKDIEKQPVNNLLATMQASLSGVQITQNNGVPGGAFTVRVRGQNSIIQGNDPFYIVDGVPFTSVSVASGDRITANGSPLASLNPSDIQSIEVLKDADATAIYGSRGASGVVLITTKRGVVGQMKSNFDFIQGVSKVGRKIDLMSTQQYLEMRLEGKKNDNSPILSTDYDINGTWSLKSNTDWQEELIGGTAPTTNIRGSLSGGSNNISYLISGNHYSEGTVFPGEHTYKRSSGNFSLQYTSNDKKIRTTFNAIYSQINSNLFLNDLTQYIILPPNYPSLLNNDATLNWGNDTMGSNPIADSLKPFTAKTKNLIGNFNLTYSPISNLQIKANFGYNMLSRDEFKSQPGFTYRPSLNPGPEQRTSIFINNSDDNWSFENQADYKLNIGKSDISFILGTTLQQGTRDLQSVTGSGYSSDMFMGNIAAASTFRSASSYSEYRYLGAFGRINYSLMNKYFLNITGRRDGSSRFGTNNRFANFGAIGASWIISEENFLKRNLKFISFAKLRASYGITGNDQIGDYGYLELWRPVVNGNYQGNTTMYPGIISNPDYSWEVNKKAEIAFELGLLNDKLLLSLGYYSNRSSNQLVSMPLPFSVGATGVIDNLPAVISNKGIETEINTKIISNKHFNWNTSFNLTIPKNKLVSFPDLDKSSYVDQYVVGKPLTIRKLYNTYVDSQTGIYMIEDYDQNNIIDARDRYLTGFKGRSLYGGIQNSLSYKKFSLDFLIQFVKQTGNGFLSPWLSYPAGSFDAGIPLRNQNKALLNRWRNVGDQSVYQKYSSQTLAQNNQFNAINSGGLNVDDASFLRLKNHSISYSFPLELTRKINVNSAKLFFQGQNLLTVTNYKGLDPETLSDLVLPTLQVFMFGMQITL
jgi:TonB-linked SusC/RagA family outer membrane protein